MTKKEQIEEIAKAIPKGYDYDNHECFIIGDSIHIAKILYNAGYRKKAYNEKQAELEAEIERLKAENYKLENDLVGFDEFARGISKTRIEITGEVIPTCKTLLEYIKKEKRNAVREFAEKLKAKARSVVGFNVRKRVYVKEYTIKEIDIDEVLKEFLK